MISTTISSNRRSLFFLLLLGAAAIAGAQPFPCRVHDGANPDVLIMTLGDVKTTLADGTFDPANDQVTLANGQKIAHYYRDSLHIAGYAPIDKSNFPLPPSGWCSWYYYYQELGENDVEQNAKWFAEHMKEYGATVIQIDDGWQGRGHGNNDNRDWTTIDKRFPSGMDHLAAAIKADGFRAGLWLAPHGQSNKDAVKVEPGAFLLKPDGTSASDTWEGNYLVDGSSKAGLDHMTKLFTTLKSWGYDYFKIDGQPIVIDEYHAKKSFMHDTTGDPVETYRSTLKAIRSAIGDKTYLLGCWGIPLAGAGIMNGSRTGGDIEASWSGFQTALSATMDWYFLHNVVWYNDPDCMLVRNPLSLDQARAWATLQGLTGQALMTSECMADLSQDRLSILKAVYPAQNIRPLDLFPAGRDKKIWDLKINHLNRQYDVVGVFNFDAGKAAKTYVAWSDLGLPEGPMHVYDYWNDEYLGAWENGIALDVPPSGCRVLSIMPATDEVALVSTSRHITQGVVDLFKTRFDQSTNTYSGKSRVIKDAPYELRFAFPRGKSLAISKVSAAGVSAQFNNHQGWATAEFMPEQSGEISWNVEFAPADRYTYPVHTPSGMTAARTSLESVNLTWDDQYYLVTGFELSVDGKLLGYTATSSFPVNGLDPSAEHTAILYSASDNGSLSKNADTLKFKIASMLPNELSLADVEPSRATIGWGSIGVNASVGGNPIHIGGKEYDHGIGTHANSDIEHRLHGMYKRFTATVGVDEEIGKEQGNLEFIVVADGKELWRSGAMKKSSLPQQIDLNIAGVQSLVLRVTGIGSSIDYDHADWADAAVSGLVQ